MVMIYHMHSQCGFAWASLTRRLFSLDISTSFSWKRFIKVFKSLANMVSVYSKTQPCSSGFTAALLDTSLSCLQCSLYFLNSLPAGNTAMSGGILKCFYFFRSLFIPQRNVRKQYDVFLFQWCIFKNIFINSNRF